MTDPITTDSLSKSWVHSHEEDRSGVQVFRPNSFSFPPSRGRQILELNSDGSFSGQIPGPDDRALGSGGKWSVQGDQLHLEKSDGVGSRDLKIEKVEPDMLVIRK